MKIFRITSVSLGAVAKHKVRTLLIVLAIVVGIATLTVIVALTQGANKTILHGYVPIGMVHYPGLDVDHFHSGRDPNHQGPRNPV